MTKVYPISAIQVPKILINDQELASHQEQLYVGDDTRIAQIGNANEIHKTWCEYTQNKSKLFFKTDEICLHVTCIHKREGAESLRDTARDLTNIDNEVDLYPSLASEKLEHEERAQKRWDTFSLILNDQPDECSWGKLLLHTFGTILIAFSVTLPFSLFPAHDLVKHPEFWYESVFHGTYTVVIHYGHVCCICGYLMNIRYTWKRRNILIICFIGSMVFHIFVHVASYILWTKVLVYQYPIPFFGVMLIATLVYFICIMIWINYPKQWRQNKQFQERMKYTVLYWFLGMGVIIYRLIATKIRDLQDEYLYQIILSLVLVLMREHFSWIVSKLIEKTTNGDAFSTRIILKYTILVSHSITMCIVIGSYISIVTSWVLVGVDFWFNLLVCARFIWLRKRSPERIQDQVDLLNSLCIAELVEFQAPLAFIMTYVVAYYGPNANLFGNISNDYWTFIPIEDINQNMKQVGFYFLVDFSSSIINAVALWLSCRINIFKVLLVIQKEFGLSFCVILGSYLNLVSTKNFLVIISNCRIIVGSGGDF